SFACARSVGSLVNQPLNVKPALCLELNTGSFIHGLDHHQRMLVGRQFLKATANGRHGGFITDKEMPVETCRYDERTSWPTDTQIIAHHRPCGPVGCGTAMVQDEINIEFFRDRVISARRIVARNGSLCT